MKALRYGISCLLAAGFAFVAACGGSTDGGSDSSGGSPGAGGKSSTGGRSGTGATNGSTAGSTGTGFPNNPACPATAPANATACTLSGTQSTCEYSGMSCNCARTRSGGGGMFPGGMAGAATTTSTREWECTATLVCPTAKPNTGDACTPAAGNCRYSGMGSCSCGQSGKWNCTGGGGPIGGMGGGFNGTGGFSFGTGGFSFGMGGFGFGTGGFGFGMAGSTGTGTGGACPAEKPAADSACTGDLSCPYTGGGCVCSSDKWTCL